MFEFGDSGGRDRTSSGDAMFEDSEEIRNLSRKLSDLLSEALHLQVSARQRGDTVVVERISAFIAGVSATEQACLHTDGGNGAFMLSRLDEQRVH
ncbi:hypothetical protein [uncultured Rhodospira sp.]|uniref:hypothetical protein n=1 Tax=uncultured Rhodospira sp. TaxID=1936189 RepID=UPI00260E99DA|nr:hypothetical protein [uncultured Rhodospira sp.]